MAKTIGFAQGPFSFFDTLIVEPCSGDRRQILFTGSGYLYAPNSMDWSSDFGKRRDAGLTNLIIPGQLLQSNMFEATRICATASRLDEQAKNYLLGTRLIFQVSEHHEAEYNLWDLVASPRPLPQEITVAYRQSVNFIVESKDSLRPRNVMADHWARDLDIVHQHLRWLRPESQEGVERISHMKDILEKTRESMKAERRSDELRVIVSLEGREGLREAD